MSNWDSYDYLLLWLVARQLAVAMLWRQRGEIEKLSGSNSRRHLLTTTIDGVEKDYIKQSLLPRTYGHLLKKCNT